MLPLMCVILKVYRLTDSLGFILRNHLSIDSPGFPWGYLAARAPKLAIRLGSCRVAAFLLWLDLSRTSLLQQEALTH